VSEPDSDTIYIFSHRGFGLSLRSTMERRVTAMWRLAAITSFFLGASAAALATDRSAASAEALAGALGDDEVCVGDRESAACALQAVQHYVHTRLAPRHEAQLQAPKAAQEPKAKEATVSEAKALRQSSPAQRAIADAVEGTFDREDDHGTLSDPLIYTARYLAGTIEKSDAGAPKEAGWQSHYSKAQDKWAAQGQATPKWAEESSGEVRLLASHITKTRASWIAPVTGSLILIMAIGALVGGRATLDRIRNEEEDAEERAERRSELEALNDSRLPSDRDESDSSTRAPSEPDMLTQGKKEEEEAQVSIFGLYRFATQQQRVRSAIALALSLCHGACMPIVFYNLDKVFNALYRPNDDGTIPPVAGPHTERDEEVMGVAKLYFCLALVACTCRGSAVMLMAYTSDHMSIRVRVKCFEKLLRHGPAWHDTHNAAEVSTKFAMDNMYHKEAAGETMVNGVRAVAIFCSAMTCALIKDWQIACVMTVALPVAGFAMANALSIVRDFSAAQFKVYAKAGGIAETGLQLIRTVTAFNGQRAVIKEYADQLDKAQHKGIRIGVVQGFSMGVTICVVGCAISIGMYAGSIWVLEGYERQCWEVSPPFGTCRTGGTMLSAMFTVLWGFTQGIGTLVVCIEALGHGKAAAKRLYDIIDEPISHSVLGQEPATCEGLIVYENVRFSYPGRQAAVALYNISMRVEPGKTAALVGSSGSGKSTIVSLLLRFYEPQAGTIFLDGVNVRNLKLSWLRARCALVDQEPVLFSCSIGENVAYGAEREVSEEEIRDACKKANAHGFINQFPDAYNTSVGERGAQLSGGQKQRISIARALIRDPSILLLDEATSALDTQSERVVQEALDALLASKKRTTIIIAHRLSTVQAADTIFVMKEGHVKEQGTHDELLKKDDSLYAKLIKRQLGAADHQRPMRTDMVEMQANVSDPSSVSDGSPAAEKLLMGGSAVAAMTTQMNNTKAEVSIIRLWRMSWQEWPLYAMGAVATICVSCMQPLYAMRFAQSMNLFNHPPVALESGNWVPDFNEKLISKSINNLVFTMQMIGVMTLATATFQQWCFHKAGEAFTSRLRLALLASVMRQDMTFFDENASGKLSHSLATDIPNIKQLVGFSLASVLQAFLGISASFGMALVISWRFTLSVVACLPLLALAPLATDMALRYRNTDNKSAAIVSESMGSMRTIASFSLESKFLDRLTESMKDNTLDDISFRMIGAAGTGIASGGLFMIYGLTVLFANIYINQGTMAPDVAMMSLFLLFSSIGGLAELSRWVDRTTEARKSAANVFALLDSRPDIDAFQEDGLKPSKVMGKVEFQDVYFRYPARPDAQVFKGFTLTIRPNTTVALVGASGSGKSTAVQLLQRFYDPESGFVCLDGNDIRKLNVRWLRSQMGLVQQEPVLFGGSILDNIAYGMEGDATDEAVVAAAKLANAHTFITELPDQYNTSAGMARGTALSGGQKQRIAIARALIRDPPILLLDEATSALDTESERMVQEALDSLMLTKARTTIVIAHRLSTVRNADQIVVVDEGKLAEMGTHDELMAKNGLYAGFAGRQKAEDATGGNAAPEEKRKK